MTLICKMEGITALNSDVSTIKFNFNTIVEPYVKFETCGIKRKLRCYLKPQMVDGDSEGKEMEMYN